MKNNYLTPIAIFFGFVLVAGAIVLSNQSSVTGFGGDTSDLTVKRVDNAWIYGNPKAETSIVEFSDLECPFCARVHPTLKQIVDESEGTINWHYRHLPLPSHRTAEAGAAVGECVGRLAGNEAFWNYSDLIFTSAERPSADYYRNLAVDQGLSAADLEACLADEAIMQQVNTDQMTARALGGSGTPFSVVVKADGSVTPVSGALPYEHWVGVLSE